MPRSTSTSQRKNKGEEREHRGHNFNNSEALGGRDESDPFWGSG